MPARLLLSLMLLMLAPPLLAQPDNPAPASGTTATAQQDNEERGRAADRNTTDRRPQTAFQTPSSTTLPPRLRQGDIAIRREAENVAHQEPEWAPENFLLTPEQILSHPNSNRQLLGTDIPPATATRLIWKPAHTFSGMAVDTPVLAVNGAGDGPTLCLTAAVHGDELNGIEMVRRVIYDIDPHKLNGMVVGVPIVNLLGFSRNSRYLPDRRDLNRYFPGNPRGSVASRIADAFFNDVVKQCDLLVDLHTGSFYRTNMPQLRADMDNPLVADFVEMFGDIPVLNSRGNRHTLRGAAVRAGIPTVTLEAGEPMRLQQEMVNVGVRTINTLMAKSGMYSKMGLWTRPAPAFYDSAWVRVNSSGILLSRMQLGDEVKEGDVLGAVSNPVSNEQIDIISPYNGRILGMALDQFVMPGFAVYHIGIHAAKGAQMPIEDESDEIEPDGSGDTRDMDGPAPDGDYSDEPVEDDTIFD